MELEHPIGARLMGTAATHHAKETSLFGVDLSTEGRQKSVT